MNFSTKSFHGNLGVVVERIPSTEFLIIPRNARGILSTNTPAFRGMHSWKNTGKEGPDPPPGKESIAGNQKAASFAMAKSFRAGQSELSATQS